MEARDEGDEVEGVMPECEWEPDLMSEGDADNAALEHDRHHGGDRVAVRISEGGQVVA